MTCGSPPRGDDRQPSQARYSTAHSPWRSNVQRFSAFTLAELVVTVGVLVVLVFLATQLLKSAATVTTLGHKQMDADSQARQLLDRMAIDFAQMVKRSDVDYYVKGTAAPDSRGRCHNRKRSDSVLQRCAGLLSTDRLAKPGLARRLSRINAQNQSSSGWEKVWSGTASRRLTFRLFLCLSRFQQLGHSCDQPRLPRPDTANRRSSR